VPFWWSLALPMVPPAMAPAAAPMAAPAAPLPWTEFVADDRAGDGASAPPVTAAALRVRPGAGTTAQQ